MSSMSKCLCTDTAMWVAAEAIQVLGGYGYLKEFPVERMMRDAKITQIYEGANEIQRLTISRNLQAKRLEMIQIFDGSNQIQRVIVARILLS